MFVATWGGVLAFAVPVSWGKGVSRMSWGEGGRGVSWGKGVSRMSWGEGG